MENNLVNKLGSKKVKSALKMGLAYLVLNTSSFLGVGLQKMNNTSLETAAFRDHVAYGRESFPLNIIYGNGLRIGYKVFYNQDNFRVISGKR